MAAATPTPLLGGGGGRASSSSSRIQPLPVLGRCRSCNCKTTVVTAVDSHTADHQHASPAIPLPHTSRRGAIGIMAAAAMGSVLARSARAEEEEVENNGWWLTGPLPEPTVANREIANEETGTRSFLRKGIYMANVGVDGRCYRLRQHAFDLLALGDLLAVDGTWNYARKYLCLKSTFMYYDFDRVISAAPVEQRKSLADLAIRLFENLENLEEAFKKKDDGMIQSWYAKTTPLLEEVRATVA